MRRLLIGLLLALAAGSALAGACDADQVKEVGTKTEVNTFGEHCLGFELPGDATEADYNVTALSVPHAVGRTLKPVKDGNPVNTLNLPIKLESGDVEDVEVNYRNQDVAYLDLTFKVSVRDGNFYRNGQHILRKSGSDYGNWLWGTLWATTFGLVSLFWIPSTTETLHYTEAIPLDSSPIHYTFGGGGNCAAAIGNSKGFWIVPSRLQPGYVYPMYAEIYCDSPLGGIRSEFGLLASSPTIRWVREGLPTRYEYEFVEWPNEGEKLSLQVGKPTITPGRFVHDYIPLYDNKYTINSGGSLKEEYHPYLPKPLNSYQVDRMWMLEENQHSGISRFKALYNRVRLCKERDEYPRNKYCAPGRTVTYERISANPPGPVTVEPRWGFPATYVGHLFYHGPDGEKARKLDVQYSIPNQEITITDTFQCVANCDKVR